MKAYASIADLGHALAGAWSPASSTRWSVTNPALGQCSVTALVVQDLFGGDILKTHTPSGVHFYNRIEGERHDLTSSQFDGPIAYDDTLSSRAEAFTDTSEAQYFALRSDLGLAAGH